MSRSVSSAARRQTVTTDISGVLVGSAHPVVVQSMTNTDTADADATALDAVVLEKSPAGSAAPQAGGDGQLLLAAPQADHVLLDFERTDAPA